MNSRVPCAGLAILLATACAQTPPKESPRPEDLLRDALVGVSVYEDEEIRFVDRVVVGAAIEDLDAILTGIRPEGPDEIELQALRWKAYCQNLLGTDSLNRGEIEQAREHFREAIDTCDRALAAEPDHAWTHYERAMAYYRRGEFEAAIPGCTRALELEPSWLKPLHWRGHLRALVGDFPNAVADLQRALEAFEDLWTLHALADAQRGLRDFAAARATYEYILEGTPRDAEALAQLGHLAGLAGDETEAVRLLREAIALERGDPLIYRRIFRWIFGAGAERAEAEGDLRYLWENGPIPEEWDRNLVGFLLGELSTAELLAAVEAEIERRESRWIRVDDLMCEVWYYVGVRHEADGDDEAAREAFARAHAIPARNTWEWELAGRRIR